MQLAVWRPRLADRRLLTELVALTLAATDGSALGNPGPGGWAWATEDGREGFAGARFSTNNRMELRALIELLHAIPASEPLVVMVDSQYVVDIFTKWLEGWRRRGMRNAAGKRVENIDLIERGAALLKGRDVRLEWVRGHDGHYLNERADVLANTAAQRAAAKLAAERPGPGGL